VKCLGAALPGGTLAYAIEERKVDRRIRTSFRALHMVHDFQHFSVEDGDRHVPLVYELMGLSRILMAGQRSLSVNSHVLCSPRREPYTQMNYVWMSTMRWFPFIAFLVMCAVSSCNVCRLLAMVLSDHTHGGILFLL
jgi:hypothetical protein